MPQDTNTNKMRYTMSKDTSKQEPTKEPVVIVRYTNKQTEMLKATCVGSNGKFDESKWKAMKESMEATGAKFPQNTRSHITPTETINSVDNAVMSAFKGNLEYTSPQGRKGYTLDAEGRLVEMSLLCRIIEPNKNQWKQSRVDAIKNAINSTLSTAKRK